ncbi:MAG: FeoB-associated Cys-rich membrane protein [Clostridia bacterium]|nr:FeoB-associated Cys-rich membrane protein [Clostridia bacterium]
MFAWIAENALTIITALVLGVAIGAAVFSLKREIKNKAGGCTGNCATCGMGCSEAKKK